MALIGLVIVAAVFAAAALVYARRSVAQVRATHDADTEKHLDQARATEQEAKEVTQALGALYAATLRLTSGGSRQSAVNAELLNQLDNITQARRTRLHLATGIVPSVLWAALTLGGFLTVGFTYFFGTENLKAQVLMTGILTVIVFMGLFVIISIDHPFTGPVHVDSAPLQHVLEDLGGG